MTSEDLSQVFKKLDEISKRQDEYQKIYLDSKNRITAAESISDTVTIQGKHLDEMSQMIASVKVTIDQLADQLYENERRLDDLEQYSRSNCLILHNDDIPPKESSNQMFENFVLSKLNSKLQLSTPLVNNDIDICHALPSKKSKNPIIIKFVRRTIHNKVFAYKKNLKSTDPKIKLSIIKSLTKRRLRLVEEARKVF